MESTVFPTKINSASIFLDFDFISTLAAGETIASHVVTASVYSGDDAAPEDIISGASSVSGSIVTQLVTAGVVGVIYILRCAVETSLGNQYIMRGYLAVIDTNPYQS